MAALLHEPEFWVLVAFLLFIGLVGKRGYVTIARMLDDRSTKISAELERAVQLREEAQALLAGYQRQQRDAVRETEDIVAKAREVAQSEAARATADLDAALERRRHAAMDEITQAEARAIEAVRVRMIDVAMAATANMLAEQIDETRSAALVDTAIESLEARLAGR